MTWAHLLATERLRGDNQNKGTSRKWRGKRQQHQNQSSQTPADAGGERRQAEGSAEEGAKPAFPSTFFHLPPQGHVRIAQPTTVRDAESHKPPVPWGWATWLLLSAVGAVTGCSDSHVGAQELVPHLRAP